MQIVELKEIAGEGPGLFYHLTDAQLRSRQEPEKGIFIAEGPKVVQTALDHGYTPVSLLMRKKFVDQPLGLEIIARCGDIPVYTAEDAVLEELTGFKLQRSWVLCAMRRPAKRPLEDVLQNARRVAVLEGITEPSNVGAIFRSAAGLGADAILVTPTCCDPLHRRAVRVCMGAVFTVPWARTGEDLGFAALRANGFKTVGLALRDNCFTLENPRISAEDRLAIYLGTEDTGLTDAALDQCDYIAKIPMREGIDSLNVAAAAAVAFWELRPRK